ncbi:MAG: hypothetical protein KC931_24710, partial [Candidatus Omnitrophica bacterium]|nr:hypothetical protein [Candidatus Omnitrophota bacterium]
TYQILPRNQWMLNPFANLKLEVLDPIPLETVEAHSTDELAKMTYDLIADRLPIEHLPLQGEPKRAMEPND